MKELFKEALAVGILLLIVSIPVMRYVHKNYPSYPGEPKTKYYVATVIIGMLVHFICEWTGINKYYCKNGVACKKK